MPKSPRANAAAPDPECPSRAQAPSDATCAGPPEPSAAPIPSAPSVAPIPSAPRARPDLRERIAREGPAALDDAALCAVLLGTGTRERPVDALARELLVRLGGLAGLASRRPEDLAREPGVGPAGASRIAAAVEIGRRLAEAASSRPVVRDPGDVVREVRDLAGERREHLVGLYLDARARLIARETVAVGTINVARASPRDLLEPALRHLAAGFVMVHNHPSGVAEPSDDDVIFTRVVGRAASLMGVPLWDHVVVARAGHASMRARGITWEGQQDAP